MCCVSLETNAESFRKLSEAILNLSDILVPADVIAAQSVENALKGKHFWRAARGLRLMYKAFQCRLINIEEYHKEHIYSKI